MKTFIMSRYTYLAILVLLVFLVGCSAPVVPILSPTNTLTPPTLTSAFTVVPLPSPTLELSTDMPTPSPIPPTHTPRLTPAPTMTADEEYALVLGLLQDNRGCRLPCWWGFTPGETFSQIIETFFTSRGKKIWNDAIPLNYEIIFDIPDYHYHHQIYNEEGDVIEMISVHALPPVGEDGHYVYGDPQFAEDWKFYMLSQILEVYGQPQQVFLETYNSILALIPFRLLLFYPDHSFLVMYDGPIGEEGQYHRSIEAIEAGEPIRVCPWRSGVDLWLWSSEREMTFEELGPVISSQVSLPRLRSLEEATGMSIEQFYQTFVQPDNQICLETPAELW